MKPKARIYLIGCAVAMLGMQLAGWMKPYAVTGCFLLVSIALLLGGEDKD